MLNILIKVMVSEYVRCPIAHNKLSLMTTFLPLNFEQVLHLLHCFLSGYVALNSGATLDRCDLEYVDTHYAPLSHYVSAQLPHLFGDHLAPRPRSRAQVDDPPHLLIEEMEFLIYLQEFVGRACPVTLFFRLAIVDVSLVLSCLAH